MAHAAAELSELQDCAPALSELCSNEVLRRVLADVANELRDKGVLDEEESFIDATFAMANGGGAEIGPTKRVENHGDCGSPRLAAVGEHARGKSS